MSGHSKWSTIRRKKEAADAKRGQAFTKYAKALAIAAREGADPDTNFKLRLAIDRAKSVNMPIANIDKAVARGSGQDSGAQLEEVVYEGYGPGGTGVLVSAATDNKNRTSAEIRSIFTKHGGRLADPGSVAYQFEPTGTIQLEPDDVDRASLVAIDGGAKDIEVDGKVLTVYTDPKQLMATKQTLEQAGFEVTSAEIGYVPKQVMNVSDEAVAKKILKLMEALEESDDVVATYSNFDIPAEMMEAVSG